MISIENLHELIVSKGQNSYGGEPVSQAQHALQCATMARRDGCEAPLIVACLLHDVGHQLSLGFSEEAPLIDRQHEVLGARYLATQFQPRVTDPISLHVTAKRYLCAVEKSYMSALSEASLHSLILQGGPLDEIDRLQFECEPFAQNALRLRRYDDLAKDPAIQADSWESFWPELVSELGQTDSSTS